MFRRISNTERFLNSVYYFVNMEPHEESCLPNEMQQKLKSLDESLIDIDRIIRTVYDVPFNELTSQTSSLDKAKLNLVAAYAINSMFWVYLNLSGENPKDHGIMHELDRIKDQMGRLKEIQDKEKAPKLDQGVAKRIVRHALWEQAQKDSIASTVNQSKKRSLPDDNCDEKQPGSKSSRTN